MADGRVIGVEKCVQIQITIGNCQFTEFLILKNMTSTLLGLPFFRKNNIVINPFKILLYLPELSISEAVSTKHDRKLSKSQILLTVSKITIHPNQQELIECEMIHTKLMNMLQD